MLMVLVKLLNTMVSFMRLLKLWAFYHCIKCQKVYYTSYPLWKEKADWWIFIKSKTMGRIEIDNALNVAYQNDVANVQQQVDVELEITLQHPQHILEKLSDDKILIVEEAISNNEKNESFDDEQWDDNENETTEKEEWDNNENETTEEEEWEDDRIEMSKEE